MLEVAVVIALFLAATAIPVLAVNLSTIRSTYCKPVTSFHKKLNSILSWGWIGLLSVDVAVWVGLIYANIQFRG